MERRRFVGQCAAALALLQRRAVAAADGAAFHAYQRVRFTGRRGEPFPAAALLPHENYLFFYPYRGTPCLLLNLGEEVGGAAVRGRAASDYRGPEGVGPRRSVVAYTAICAHLWSHPEKEATVIAYRGPEGASTICEGGRRITCCAHGSCYDPAAGGVVVQGPAEIPLAAVDLEWDTTTDELTARGMWGRDSFREFFASFPTEDRNEATTQAPVVLLRDYSAIVARC